MNPDCAYCWLKDGANIDHICDVVNVKKNLDTQWEITAETQRHLERCINSKNTQVEKARAEAYEYCAKLAEDCPHVGEPCCYCGQKIAQTIRTKLNQKGE